MASVDALKPSSAHQADTTNSAQIEWFSSYQSKPSKAKPKHTLFGSSLEKVDKEDAEKLNKLDTKKYEEEQEKKRRTNRYAYPVPPHDKLPGEVILSSSKEDVNKLRSSLSGTEAFIKSKEEAALMFNTQTPTNVSSAHTGSVRDRPHQWLTTKDLEHTSDMNTVGLNARSSFNHAKYGKKPPVHSYSLIGDMLRPGMDIPVNYNENAPTSVPPAYGRRARPMESSTDQPHTGMSRQPHACIDLPPNIRHQFGSRVCDSLLSDKGVVQQLLEEQVEKYKRMKRSEEPPKVVKYDDAMNVQYSLLSNAMRQNVCPGYSTDHKQSTTKSIYNDGVFGNRLQDPDQYRYRRDELSTWAEHNVLRERMKKAWEKYSGHEKNS